MADVRTWLAGFTYRGRAPWENMVSEYHVEIGEYVEVEGRDPVQLGVKVLTPDAAKAAGYTLAATLKSINGTALSEVEALRVSVADLSGAKAGAEGLLEEARADLDKAKAAHDKDVATISDLQTALKEARADLQRETQRASDLQAQLDAMLGSTPA